MAPFGKLPTAAVLAAGRIRSVPLMPGVPTPADAEGLGARVADGTFADGRPAPCLIAAAAPAGDTTATAFAAGTCGLPRFDSLPLRGVLCRGVAEPRGVAWPLPVSCPELRPELAAEPVSQRPPPKGIEAATEAPGV